MVVEEPCLQGIRPSLPLCFHGVYLCVDGIQLLACHVDGCAPSSLYASELSFHELALTCHRLLVRLGQHAFGTHVVTSCLSRGHGLAVFINFLSCLFLGFGEVVTKLRH